jgi:hypothetical protein
MVQAEFDLMERKPSQKQRILNLLKQRGIQGVYNYEFSNMYILCHTKRLSELYADGHNIKKIPLRKGVYKYVLTPERETVDIS